MDLLIKATTPFGDEHYNLSIEEGKPAYVSFRENTVEIPDYSFSEMGFHAVFNIDVPMTSSILLTFMKNINGDAYSGIAKIGNFTTVDLTATIL
jgi:hypothetical protein